MNQPTLFDLEAFTKFENNSVHDPYWDQVEIAEQQTHSVGGQIIESESPYKSVGGKFHLIL